MNPPSRPIVLHRMRLSGHSHRVELFLSLLQLPYETVEVDLLAGEHKRPVFVALNCFGQVPVIVDGDVTIGDSNAILVYLDGRYAGGQWLPRDPVGAAQVQRWLSVAAGALVNGPARARASVLFGAPLDPRCADIAFYSYTSHAPEGGNSLQPYPQVRAWLQRIEALPGFVGMARQPEHTPS